VHPSLLRILACPVCAQPLSLEVAELVDDRVKTGSLQCAGGHRYRIERFVPRFVADDQYAASFGMQWNRFKRTQLDRHNGTSISRDRLVQVTGWRLESLRGQRVLDAGCGAGRFARVALDYGAELVAMDLSNAVDACYDNLGPHDRLHVVQASIYEPPFRAGTFDRVYSIGVLQHTPDVERAVKALPALLKLGGTLAYWIYEKKLMSMLMPKYPLRLVGTRIPAGRLFTLLEKWVPLLLRTSNLVGRFPLAGPYLRKLVPVANYTGALPLTALQIEEWALLDTFDWLAPAYDQPQTYSTVRRWLEEAGCRNIQRIPGRGIGLPVTAQR
jgi:SAM-dependent methyltransferase